MTRQPSQTSKRTARARSLAVQRPVEWALLPSGWDVIEVRDHRGWRHVGNSIDQARRAFGLATSSAAVAA